jgi:hypothetical protein
MQASIVEIAMIFERQRVHEGRVRRLTVENRSGRWNVREEEDATIIRERQHDDWHRVERAVRLFEEGKPLEPKECDEPI